jgi:nitroreductase
VTEANRGWLGVELDPDWYEAIPARVSRRRYDGRPVSAPEWARLTALADRLSASGVRTTPVCRDGEELFLGIIGGYGKVVGSPCAAIFSAPEGCDLQLGYAGEAFVLAATAMGLSTCWVAGNFHRKKAARHVPLAEGEHVRAVTPIGYAVPRLDTDERAITTVVRARRRLDAEEIAPGVAGWPQWARTAIEAARLAPSGGNKQPWRFALEDGELVLTDHPAAFYWTHRMDCGIAMLHAELGALDAGVRGSWRTSAGVQRAGAVRGASEVARFVTM